ncbi:hypothetical protein ANO11243_094810 [Dothideomycetidae sp. 11243]|nr:hypothetical protein ANO11243_094810 [fungal sp. No.11243]
MRPSAIVPIILSLGALVLSFLCLFAGSKTTFLANAPIITLNTSEFGSGALNNSGSAAATLINDLPSGAQQAVDNAINSVARRLGLHEFYTANLRTYCEGYYTPGPVPNATLKAKNIHKQFTNCSKPVTFFQFNPKQVIQDELNASGHSDINISQLSWPTDIDRGLKAVHTSQKAAFVLYCIALGTIGLATIFSIVSFCLNGRLSAFIMVMICGLAFLAIGLASAVVTVVAIHGSRLINKYGNPVGLSSHWGVKYLAFSWAATGAMVLCSLWWCADCLIGRRNQRARYVEKPNY